MRSTAIYVCDASHRRAEHGMQYWSGSRLIPSHVSGETSHVCVSRYSAHLRASGAAPLDSSSSINSWTTSWFIDIRLSCAKSLSFS